MNIFRKKYKICPNKHTIYSFDDEYCWVCGTKLNTTLNNPIQKLVCHQCKKIADRADNYCTKCGAQLVI